MNCKSKAKEKVKIKLAAYTALAGALAATTNNAEAQIIYTDVNPDSTVSLGQYPLDMNNDGTPEFFIDQTISYSSQVVAIINNNNGRGWVGYDFVGFNYASALNAGVSVGQFTNFNNPTPLTSFAAMVYVSTYGYAFGQWQGATDKFLGLRFTFGGNTYYGWARVTVPMSGDSFTIKDYAFNSTPNSPINTGDRGAAPMATGVFASDIADNGNGSDLQVSFIKAADEDPIAEYRIIVVPSADTASFDITAANAVTAANYTAVAKTGSNIQTTLLTTATDKNGNAIVNNIEYNIYILSVADGTFASVNSLSAKSNTITLLNKTAPTAGSVVVSDVGNQGDGSDMQVEFNKANDETKISEYRIIVVPSIDTVSFGLAAANFVASGNYTTVNKTGSDISTILSATANDKNGNPIINNVNYNVFILSVADGSIAVINSLSEKSNIIELKNTVGIDDLDKAGITAYAFGKTINIYAPSAEFDDRIMIIDLSGRIVYNEEINGNSKRIILDKAAGVYILKVSKEGRFFSKKLFID